MDTLNTIHVQFSPVWDVDPPLFKFQPITFRVSITFIIMQICDPAQISGMRFSCSPGSVLYAYTYTVYYCFVNY